MKTLLALLLISIAITAQAGKLSQLATQVPRSLQKAVAVVICATTCLVGFNLEASGDHNQPKSVLQELTMGGASGHKHLFLGGKLGIPGLNPYGSFASLDTLVAFRHDGDSSNLQPYFENLNLYFFRTNNEISGNHAEDYYPHLGRIIPTLSVLGFDYNDKHTFELEDGTKGFRTGHLHLVGADSSVIVSKVGIGRLGSVDTGWFEQEDLEAWAGDKADFSYQLFLTNGFGLGFHPPGSTASITAIALQERTVGGNIDFADGAEGEFVALWESFKVDAELSLGHKDSEKSYGDVRIRVAASVFRQRLSANTETGEKFSQRKNGHRLGVSMIVYFY